MAHSYRKLSYKNWSGAGVTLGGGPTTGSTGEENSKCPEQPVCAPFSPPGRPAACSPPPSPWRSASADLALTAQALGQVRSWASGNGRQLTISYTIPTLPTGLTSTGESVLTTALANGFTPDIVNIMTMDYGSSGTEMGAAANQALDAVAGQLDSNGAFTEAFQPFTTGSSSGGGGGSPTPTPTPTPTSTGSGSCASAWVSSTAYVSGNEVSYNGDNWTANQWNYDEVPGGPAGAWNNDGAC